MEKQPADAGAKRQATDFADDPPRLPKRQNPHPLVHDFVPDPIKRAKPVACAGKNLPGPLPPVLDPVDTATLIALSQTKEYETCNLLLFSGNTEGRRNFTGSK